MAEEQPSISEEAITADEKRTSISEEAITVARKSLKRGTVTALKEALPTAGDLDAEKGDKSCDAGRTVQYSCEEVEKLLIKFEGASKKQCDKAPEDIANVEQDELTTGIKIAENALMVAAELLRDICTKALKGQTKADRDYLDEVFGIGCNCTRFIRLRDAVGTVTLSKMNAQDPRWPALNDRMDTIEQILIQRGSFKAPVIVVQPKALVYSNLGPVGKGKQETVDVGEEVSWDAALDGMGATFTISPALPDHMGIEEATGVISGAAYEETEATKYTVTASNAAGSVSFTFTFGVVQPPPTALTYPSLEAQYLVGASVEGTPEVVGGVCKGYHVEPALPDGVHLDTTTGALSGAPTDVSGPTTYWISCWNDRGEAHAEVSMDVTEPAPTALTYPTIVERYNLDEPLEDVWPDSHTIRNFSVSPALPTGIYLDEKTGALSGTPTVATPSGDYCIVGTNKGGQVSFNFKFDVYVNVIKKICECEDVSVLLSDYDQTGKEWTEPIIWMVWMVHRVQLNDESLTELDFTDMEMPPPEIQPKIAPKLMKALESSLHLTDLKLVNSKLKRPSCDELSDALKVNTILKLVNVSSNDLSTENIIKMSASIRENKDTKIHTLNFSLQKSLGEHLGDACEQALLLLVKENNTITKMPVKIQNGGTRTAIDSYLIQNVTRSKNAANAAKTAT